MNNIALSDNELVYIENGLMFYYGREVDLINSVTREYNKEPSEETLKRLDEVWKTIEKIRQCNPGIFE